MRAIGKEAGLKSFEQVRLEVGELWPRSLLLLSSPLLPPSAPPQVRGIYLHPEMFSISNGLLTPTLKSRRADIRRAFQEQIETLYRGALI